MATEVGFSTGDAPGAIGPYSQAIKVGNLVFTAGQIPLDPATGKLVEGDIVAAERVLRNLAAILIASGSSLGRVVKTTCFLANLDDFAKFNEVYGQHFGDNRPARSTVQVSRLPAGKAWKMMCVAECGGRTVSADSVGRVRMAANPASWIDEVSRDEALKHTAEIARWVRLSGSDDERKALATRRRAARLRPQDLAASPDLPRQPAGVSLTAAGRD